MKKLFILTLIATLSLFALTACDGLVPAEGEGEGEGEVVTEGVTVNIEDAIEVEGRTYLSRGEHEITVTFPSPVTGIVRGYITYCTGDYSKDKNGEGTEVVLFPNSDRTVWTGSGSFQDSASLCCASYLQITSGECNDEVCINMPVIVDSAPPYAVIEVCLDDCDCGGCALSFNSTTTQLTCSDTVNCGDDCSGLAGWSIALYEDYPYNECCEIPCEEPIDTCSGTACPIECTTECLTGGTYYAVVTLSDATGNEVSFGAEINIDPEDCNSIWLDSLDPNDCLDELWNSGFIICEKNTSCYPIPFEEDFTGVAEDDIPFGWSTTDIGLTNWKVKDFDSPLGNDPVMQFFYYPFFNGVSRLISPCIDATGCSNIELNFNHSADHYSLCSQGDYILKVQVSTDGGETWTDKGIFIPSSDIPPANITVDLSSYDGQIFNIAWVVDGNSECIQFWYIDDINIYED